jgi:hypothetical protein
VVPRLRSVLACKPFFQMSVEAAGKRLFEIDVSQVFGEWIGAHQYAETFFSKPIVLQPAKNGATCTVPFGTWIKAWLVR